jgi:hypothetical protein
MLDIAQPQRIAAEEVEQASRRGDQHIDAVEQGAHLCAHGYAADHERRVDMKEAAVGPEAVEDLAAQLARRAEHQDPAGLAFRPAPAREQVMQDRKRERRRLAGTGLSNADHVAPGQGDRNGVGLDGSGRDVFLFGERTRDGFGEAEIVKKGQVLNFLLRESASSRRRA